MPALHTAYQPGILWNIKANEVLLEALKLSRPSNYNRQWMARLEAENKELKARSTLYGPFQLWFRKYNPDQPRAPAGNSDGGQWTDGGASGDAGSGTRIASGHGRFGGGVALAKKPDASPKAPDGTPVQLAQADNGDPRKYSIDLNEEEAPTGIGHTIRKHVAQSDEALKARMRADYRQWGPPRGRTTVFAEAYGSFDNQISANDMINRVLQSNKESVDAVARGERSVATLNMRFGHPTGKEAYRPKSNSSPYMRTTFDVRVIIKHDNTTKRGYRVRTAMPCNEEPERKP